jgi:hypothetical protein
LVVPIKRVTASSNPGDHERKFVVGQLVGPRSKHRIGGLAAECTEVAPRTVIRNALRIEVIMGVTIL